MLQNIVGCILQKDCNCIKLGKPFHLRKKQGFAKHKALFYCSTII